MVFNVSEIVLNKNGFSNFNPMQKKVVEMGFKKSLIVSAPTASGKTIVAELFMLEEVLNKNKKVIYTCPLRALASEHYSDFKKKYSPQGADSKIKFAVSTGDLDSSSSYLKNFDVIMTTYEKLASLLRHKTDWLKDVGGIIIDEIHELDSDRGPVLEIALTQMRMNNPKLLVLGLSATIPNAKELSSWLNAELVESNFRPTKLREGVLLENSVEYNDNSIEEGELENIIEKNLKDKKQLLIFMNARKRAEQMAQKMTVLTKKFVDEKDFTQLGVIAKKVLGALESPTEQCTSLAESIKCGSAFHHAGLMNDQREIVEENFKNGKIKILCATPTLAAGINAPADVVIIPSLYRFEKYGMELISVREYKQMCTPYSTKIVTKEFGEIKIGEIHEKKLKCSVLSFNEKTNKSEFNQVQSTFKRKVQKLIKIETNTNTVLTLTPNHEVATLEGKKLIWKKSAELSKFDSIIQQDYAINKISKISPVSKKINVYNLKVKRNENYFANGILTHNCGRSGRPKFSTEGKSIIVANGEDQKDMFLEKFVNGKIEVIESKLSIIPILRTHILALIATEYIRDIKSIESFFERTLYAHQFQNMAELLDNVLEIVESLVEYKFVEKKEDKFYATILGKRVSDLFLDPDSAFELITALKAKKTFTSLSYLYAWVNCTEFFPLLRPSKNIHASLLEEMTNRVDELPFSQEKILFEIDSTEKFFSSLMLEYWIKEKKEQDLFKEFNLAPGTLFGKNQIIEWLSYATIELSKVLHEDRHQINVQKLSKRVKYGVKEELLLLIELRGIGRMRARKLFDAGIKRPSEIRPNIHKVQALLGKTVADELEKQLLPKEGGALSENTQKTQNLTNFAQEKLS